MSHIERAAALGLIDAHAVYGGKEFGPGIVILNPQQRLLAYIPKSQVCEHLRGERLTECLAALDEYNLQTHAICAGIGLFLVEEEFVEQVVLTAIKLRRATSSRN